MSLRKWLKGNSPNTQPGAEVYRMLKEAHAHLLAEGYDKARRILLKAIELRPRIADAKTVDCILQALEATWLLQNEFDEQIAFFSEYLARFRHDASAYQGRGSALWYLGRLKEALEDYSRAVELQPSGIWGHSGRGQILAELGDSKVALDELDIALRLVRSLPTDQLSGMDAEAFVRRGRGVALANLKRIPEALKEFEASMELNPENAWLYYSRARVYERMGKTDAALADYKTALKKTNPSLTPLQKDQARQKLGLTTSSE